MAQLSDNERFLLDFHREHPGATPRIFGGGTLSDGRSSYAWMADVLPEDARGLRVLDLACGDGHLSALIADRGASVVGVDMSPDDLQLAAARDLPGARFEVARAQQLPLATASLDCVLCHLALMLMDDIEQVLREVARVLRPGGTFAAVLGGGTREGDGWSLFVRHFRDLHRDFGLDELSLGDPRTRALPGLRELLEGGFEDIDSEARTLDMSGPSEAVWSRLSASYLGGRLTEAGLTALKGRWMADVAPIEAAGAVPAALEFLRVRARRAATSEPA